MRGEGIGVVVVKSLAAAIRDRNRVYAVVRASAINQDGATNGLTAPSRRAQEELLRVAWRRAGVRPADVGYIEAHGSGTALGDAIELAAIDSVLAEGDRRGEAHRNLLWLIGCPQRRTNRASSRFL